MGRSEGGGVSHVAADASPCLAYLAEAARHEAVVVAVARARKELTLADVQRVAVVLAGLRVVAHGLHAVAFARLDHDGGVAAARAALHLHEHVGGSGDTVLGAQRRGEAPASAARAVQPEARSIKNKMTMALSFVIVIVIVTRGVRLIAHSPAQALEGGLGPSRCGHVIRGWEGVDGSHLPVNIMSAGALHCVLLALKAHTLPRDTHCVLPLPPALQRQ